MKKLASLLALALALAAAAPDAAAQVKLGPRLTIDIGDIEEFAIGADARINPATLPVQFNGNFDFYFVDGADVFGIDLNAVYLFGVNNAAFTPYAGAGLGILALSNGNSETEVGINLVGGAEFPVSPRLTPFVQLQATLGSDVDRLGITGGLLFNL
jgi:opacity protein-like surface antigen